MEKVKIIQDWDLVERLLEEKLYRSKMQLRKMRNFSKKLKEIERKLNKHDF
tara:strand:- start:43 stop:195 length:153 start_codon:yes stop_codon:yes gene_type:complete